MLKKILTISGIVALVGIIIAGIAICLGGASAKGANIEMITHRASEPFSSVAVEAGASDIRIEKSQSGECYAMCEEGNSVTFSLSVNDGVLTLKEIDERKWYQHIGFFFRDRDAVLYLPADSYESLRVGVSSGDVDVDARISFGSADIKVASGEVDFNADVTGALKIELISGGIELGAVNAGSIDIGCTSGDVDIERAKADSINVKTTSGDVDLSGVNSSDLSVRVESGTVELENVFATAAMQIKTTSGRVELEGCDSMSIEIECVSGSVRGSLASGKLFDVKTGSGSVRHPDSVEGHGSCKIRTTSGSVRITVR